MNWITTNIRFPEDEYMKLKLISAQKRESLSSIVRNAIKKTVLKKTQLTPSEIKARLNKIAKIIGKHVPKNWDTVKAIREIRYGS